WTTAEWIEIVRLREGIHEEHCYRIQPVGGESGRKIAGLDPVCRARLDTGIQAPLVAKRVAGNRRAESRPLKQALRVGPLTGVGIPDAKQGGIGILAEFPLTHQRSGNCEGLVS